MHYISYYYINYIAAITQITLVWSFRNHFQNADLMLKKHFLSVLKTVA